MKRRWWVMGAVLLALAAATAGAGCDVVDGPGTISGTVRYARDPAGALDDPQNAGEPAAGVKVLVYGVESKGSSAGGMTIYQENQHPNLELVTDEQGRYQAEAPAGRYIIRLQPDPQAYNHMVDVGPWRNATADFVIRRPGAALPTPAAGPDPTPPPPSPYPAAGQ